MKKIILFLIFSVFFIATSYSQNSKYQKQTFKVWGNCGMCKSVIEKAAESIDGVKYARWDSVKGIVKVKFLTNKTDLNEIQKKLSVVFSKYKKNNEIPEFFRTNKQLYDSYLDFGFPFVGEHWIPHFTISSLKVGKNHKLINDFLLDQIDISFTVNKVSIWNIKGNQHQMIEEFILK